MIVGHSFPGDDNDRLKRVQYDAYGDLAGYLFFYARERYLNAMRFIGLETQLGRVIVALRMFDHRVLQDAHDIIASFYRFAHDRGAQMPLFATLETWDKQLREDWCSFYEMEVRRLIEHDPIATAILTAVAHQHASAGAAAEQHLAFLLRQRYGELRPAIARAREGAEDASSTNLPAS